jgi:hypothetical protein
MPVLGGQRLIRVAPGIKHVTVTSVSFSSLRKGEREGINKRLGTVIDRLEGDTPLL